MAGGPAVPARGRCRVFTQRPFLVRRGRGRRLRPGSFSLLDPRATGPAAIRQAFQRAVPEFGSGYPADKPMVPRYGVCRSEGCCKEPLRWFLPYHCLQITSSCGQWPHHAGHFPQGCYQCSVGHRWYTRIRHPIGYPLCRKPVPTVSTEAIHRVCLSLGVSPPRAGPGGKGLESLTAQLELIPLADPIQPIFHSLPGGVISVRSGLQL